MLAQNSGPPSTAPASQSTSSSSSSSTSASAEKSGAEKSGAEKTSGGASVKLDTNVDPAKKAAIKELLTLTKMNESFNAIRDVMLSQVRRTINTLVQKQISDDTKVSSAQRKAMLDTFSDSSDRIINRYRELFSQRVDMPAIMEQVAYKVYDESFTTSEVQDLIAFYRTPTGQKSLKELPEIIQRSMNLSTQLITPKVIDIVKEVVSEEISHLRSETVSKPAPDAGLPAPTSSADGAATSAPANSKPTTAQPAK